MTATRLDITIEQGADYATPFAFNTDLTGFAAFMQVRLAAGYPYPILSLTSQAGGLLVDPVGGTVLPVIPAGVSAAINAGRYAYDLKLVGPTGQRIRAYEGAAYVSAEVTDEATTPVPAPVGALLLESGGYLLLEAGGRLLFEDGAAITAPAILLEGGGYLLLEAGGRLLREDGVASPTGAVLLEGGGYLLNETAGKTLLEA